MAKNIHNNIQLPNKTLEANGGLINHTHNGNTHHSPTNETIPAPSDSSLPQSSTLESETLLQQHPPQQHEQIINPTDDVILANVTNFSVNTIKNNSRLENETNDESAFAKIIKMHQYLLSTLSPNTCPPIPPNLGNYHLHLKHLKHI